MASDPTRDEMLAFLETTGVEDEFDREEAVYWFAANYHGGQSSNLYEALSMSPYAPGLATNEPDDDFAYDLLISEYAPEDEDDENAEDDDEDDAEDDDE
jgi:hypothetical protein